MSESIDDVPEDWFFMPHKKKTDAKVIQRADITIAYVKVQLEPFQRFERS